MARKTKAELAAEAELENAESAEPELPTYTLALVDGVNGVQFHVDGQEVELAAGDTFQVQNVHVYRGLLELPHLHDPADPKPAIEQEEAA
jgi:hypothetical protein